MSKLPPNFRPFIVSFHGVTPAQQKGNFPTITEYKKTHAAEVKLKEKLSPSASNEDL